jgi:hypothetical protein
MKKLTGLAGVQAYYLIFRNNPYTCNNSKQLKGIIKILLLLMLVSFMGCSPYELTPEMKKFKYNYKIEGKNKKQIWKLARNHFALVYGDFRSVLRVQDEEEGSIIGKGKVKWSFGSESCWHDYNIRFDAEDRKAKLRLNLIEVGTCRLTEEGYETIKANFWILDRGLRRCFEVEDCFYDN